MKFRAPYLLQILLLAALAAAACKDRGQHELSLRQEILTSRKALEEGVRPGMAIEDVIRMVGPPAVVLETDAGERHYHFIAPLPIPPRERDCGGVDVRVKDDKVVFISILEVR